MPQGLMREVMETYKPHILSRRRRLIEDCVRDLRLNNDHIHIIEQEMRLALQVKKTLSEICIWACFKKRLPHSSNFFLNFLARTK